MNQSCQFFIEDPSSEPMFDLTFSAYQPQFTSLITIISEHSKFLSGFFLKGFSLLAAISSIKFDISIILLLFDLLRMMQLANHLSFLDKLNLDLYEPTLYFLLNEVSIQVSQY
jgi:hypothetical protein